MNQRRSRRKGGSSNVGRRSSSRLPPIARTSAGETTALASAASRRRIPPPKARPFVRLVTVAVVGAATTILLLAATMLPTAAAASAAFFEAFATIHRRSPPAASRRRIGSAAVVASSLSSRIRSRACDDDGTVAAADAAARRIKSEKSKSLSSSSTLSLAPMMEYTDRHFRHVVRLLSSRTLLYSEMVAANAIAHERRDAIDSYLAEYPPSTHDVGAVHSKYDPSNLLRYVGQGTTMSEGPSVLQLGGSDPDMLYEASRTVKELTDRGDVEYTALNLNCGCPSPKVAGKGCFGAALMDEPKLVSRLVEAMDKGCGKTMPVTVKCRIGTDSGYTFTRSGYDSFDPEKEYAKLCNFIETVARDGVVSDFQIHGRIAVLGKSFSPADNRKIPPLKYDVVRRLVKDYPELTFSLNGGIETLSDARRELDVCPRLQGVMIGRGFVSNPWHFAMADQILYGDDDDGDKGDAKPKNRMEVLRAYGIHADAEERTWDPVKIRRFLTKAVSGLFAGEPNAKRFRVALDEIGGLPKKLAKAGRGIESEPPLSELILDAATRHLSEEVLLRSPEESYEMTLWEEERRKAKLVGGGPIEGNDGGVNRRTSEAVKERQTERKTEEEEQLRQDNEKEGAAAAASA